MGTYHFMGVGRSVGTVTCAVDYIEKALDKIANNQMNPEIIRLFQSSGGINHLESDPGKIEALVLFTSSEVIRERIHAFPYTGNNDPGSVREEIVQNLRKVWKRADPDEGRKIFWCEVDIDNYQDCFDKIIKLTYRFCPPEKQGKEIWCNLTGGTNAIGFSLLAMAQLTGKSTKQYLISQRREYQREVRVPCNIRICPDKDQYFNIIPFLKTYIDTIGFYDILIELNLLKHSITTRDLFSRFASKQSFAGVDFNQFKRHYMLKLYGLGYTDYDTKTDTNMITNSGRNFVNELENLKVVIEMEEKIAQGERDLVTESKDWLWLQEEQV
nr:hypothetical protein [Oscillochloris trichoides]